MRLRFEHTGLGRFWEAAIAGGALTVRAGTVGTEGRVTIEKSFDDDAAAVTHVEGIVQTLKKRGYEQIAGGDEPRDAELEAAILADPDAEQPRLVYGDWLQTQGHPRGELCAIQHALAAKPDDRKLQSAQRKLLGDTSVCPEALRKATTGRAMDLGKSCDLHWRMGFVHEAVLARSSTVVAQNLHELVVALLGHPCSRLLHALTIGARASKAGNYEDVVADLTQWKPASLRALTLVRFPESVMPLDAVSLGAIDDMVAALPDLERLHLRAGIATLGELSMPRVRELTIETTSMQGVLKTASGFEAPALEHLHLHESNSRRGAMLMGDRYEKARLPWSLFGHGLRRLSLTHTVSTWRRVQELAASPLATSITDLSLAHGDLVDDHELELQRFPKLERLDVTDNALTSHGLRRLAETVDVVGADQRKHTEFDRAWLRDFAAGGAAIETAARIATREHFPELYRHEDTFWARYRHKDKDYLVQVAWQDPLARCTCKSRLRPCKHAIALAMTSWKAPATHREPPRRLQDHRDDYYDGIHE